MAARWLEGEEGRDKGEGSGVTITGIITMAINKSVRAREVSVLGGRKAYHCQYRCQCTHLLGRCRDTTKYLSPAISLSPMMSSFRIASTT